MSEPILETQNFDEVLALVEEKNRALVIGDVDRMLNIFFANLHRKEPDREGQTGMFYTDCTIKGANCLFVNKNGINGTVVYKLIRIDEDQTIRNDYTGKETILKGYACD